MRPQLLYFNQLNIGLTLYGCLGILTSYRLNAKAVLGNIDVDPAHPNSTLLTLSLSNISVPCLCGLLFEEEVVLKNI